MAQTFVICKGSTLPYLRMEVVNDGRYDFKKIYLALQSADITFTMTNLDTGVKKIAKAEAFVVEREDSGCEEAYDIEYRWKKRDNDTPGIYIGELNVKFDGNIPMDGGPYADGDLIVPITEDLVITVSDNMIKK